MQYASRFFRRLFAAILLASVVSSNSATAQTKPFQIQSISFALVGSNYLDNIAGWTPIPIAIQQMKDLGANDVKVTITAGAYATPADNLPDPTFTARSAPTDDKIVAFLKQLKAAGLQVTVQPFVDKNADPNGNLLDTVASAPTDFNVWIAEHTRIVVHLAQLAEQAGVDRFIVFGDEVQNLTYGTTHTAGWLDMVAQVRQVFSRHVTSELYADGTIFGGGASHIELVDSRLIDAVDSIGIGWFPQPLTNTNDPGMARLLAAWRNTVKGVDTVAFLKGIHEKHNKAVWIADIALHSFSGDNVRNGDIYNMTKSLVADQQEQADEYDSLLSILSKDTGSWFLGICFDSWNRFPLDYRNTARFTNSEYGENIRGKLAETVLRDWYTGVRGWKNVALVPGWNLVGNSVNVPLDVVTSFGRDKATNVASVWKWNPITSKWAFYAPGPADGGAAYAASKSYESLISIGAGEGFWVNATQALTAQLPVGTAVSSSSFDNLSSGWRLISVGDNATPRDFNKSVGASPSSSGSAPLNLKTLWAWDSSSSRWYFYAPSLDARGGTALSDYIASQGYIDFTAANKKLEPDAGFWINKP